MRLIIFSSVALALAGCATSSGVVPAGSGTLNISKQAASGFSGLGNLKAEAHQEAADYCGRSKKDFEVVKYDEVPGPYYFGKFPRVDLTFKCV